MGVLKVWDASTQQYVPVAAAVPTFDEDLPGVHVSRTTLITMPSGEGIVPYTNVVRDSDGYWNGTDGFIVPAGKAGRYNIGCSGNWENQSGNPIMSTQIWVNSVGVTPEFYTIHNKPSTFLSHEMTLAEGDLVQVRLWNGAGAQKWYGSPEVVNYLPQFWMTLQKGAKGDKGEMPEAPQDGKMYGRMNGAWVEIV